MVWNRSWPAVSLQAHTTKLKSTVSVFTLCLCVYTNYCLTPTISVFSWHWKNSNSCLTLNMIRVWEVRLSYPENSDCYLNFSAIYTPFSDCAWRSLRTCHTSLCPWKKNMKKPVPSPRGACTSLCITEETAENIFSLVFATRVCYGALYDSPVYA